MLIETEESFFETFFKCIQVEITGICNMRCKHCRAANEVGVNMPVETIERVLMFGKANSEDGFALTISGGEPFCHPALMDVVRMAKGLLIENVTITTNGSLVSDKQIRELEDIGVENLRIQVSLDNVDAERHDLFRGYGGAYAKAIRCLQEVANSRILPLLRTAVLPSTIDEMDAMVRLAESHNIKSIGFNPVIPVGRGGLNEDLLMTPEQKRSFIGNLKLCISNHPDMDITTEDPLQCLASDYPVSSLGDSAVFGGCMAGIASFGVNSLGDIVACALLSKAIVNVNGKTSEEILNAYTSSEIIRSLVTRKYQGKCGSCNLKRICGGCRAVAEGTDGDFLSSDVTCWK